MSNKNKAFWDLLYYHKTAQEEVEAAQEVVNAANETANAAYKAIVGVLRREGGVIIDSDNVYMLQGPNNFKAMPYKWSHALGPAEEVSPAPAPDTIPF